MTASARGDRAVPVKEISAEEGRKLLDEQARRYLGMSGDEFSRRWADGTIADADRTDVLRVAMLLPLASNNGTSDR